MMKCKICGEECDGKLNVIDPSIEGKTICCSQCFELWTNNEYQKLIDRMEKN